MAGVGCALLAVIVLCPLMATAAATPSASSCHDRQAPDHHGDTSAAFTCCATVVVKPSVQAAPEADVTLAPAVDAVRHPARQTGWHADHPSTWIRIASPVPAVRLPADLIVPFRYVHRLSACRATRARPVSLRAAIRPPARRWCREDRCPAGYGWRLERDRHGDEPMHGPHRRRSALAAALAAASLVPALAAAQPAAPEDTLDFYGVAPDLRAYVTAAAERNPTVLEAHARYEAARQRVPQVTALPDPVVGFTQALRSVETRVGPQLNSVTLTQAFPWFGTLALRGRVALLEATALHHIHQAARWDVVAQVKEAYYDLGYIDEALGLAREEQSLPRALRGAVQGPLRHGPGSPAGGDPAAGGDHPGRRPPAPARPAARHARGAPQHPARPARGRAGARRAAARAAGRGDRPRAALPPGRPAPPGAPGGDRAHRGR